MLPVTGMVLPLAIPLSLAVIAPRAAEIGPVAAETAFPLPTPASGAVMLSRRSLRVGTAATEATKAAARTILNCMLIIGCLVGWVEDYLRGLKREVV